MNRSVFISIVFLCFILTGQVSKAQEVDSTYIGFYDQKLSATLYIERNYLTLTSDEGDKSTSYRPNTPTKIGAGFSINNTAFNFAYGYGLNFLLNKDMGKTKSFDFQLHHYGRKFIFDVFIQRYRGFYVEGENQQITLYPDLKARQYGLHGQYVFNGKKFSHKAAFNQNERQKHSAGSFTLGGGMYMNRIESGVNVLRSEEVELDNFQFGISGGYAYTWAIGQHWFLSGSGTIGANFSHERTDEGRKWQAYPTSFFRFAFGYNHEKWALALNYHNNSVYPSLGKDSAIELSSGTLMLAFTKRFDTMPFFSRKQK